MVGDGTLGDSRSGTNGRKTKKRDEIGKMENCISTRWPK